MKYLFKMLTATTFYMAQFLVLYIGVFHGCLSDDVEFNYGKARLKKQRKKDKGFWSKFLFLNVRREVNQFHYVMFWIYLIFSLFALIALNVFVILDYEGARKMFIALYAPAFISSAIIACCRWHLYAQNRVRNRKRFHKKQS